MNRLLDRMVEGSTNVRLKFRHMTRFVIKHANNPYYSLSGGYGKHPYIEDKVFGSSVQDIYLNNNGKAVWIATLEEEMGVSKVYRRDGETKKFYDNELAELVEWLQRAS